MSWGFEIEFLIILPIEIKLPEKVGFGILLNDIGTMHSELNVNQIIFLDCFIIYYDDLVN